MSRGRRDRRATLASTSDDATPTVYDPATIWLALSPAGPSGGDERVKPYQAETDYNAQLSTATKMTLDDGRVLFIRGIQSVEDRHRTHLLYCEEMLNP